MNEPTSKRDILICHNTSDFSNNILKHHKAKDDGDSSMLSDSMSHIRLGSKLNERQPVKPSPEPAEPVREPVYRL